MSISNSTKLLTQVLNAISGSMSTVRLVTYLLGKVGISIATTTMFLYASELYPTECRHTLVAFSSTVGRLGTIIAPLTPVFVSNKFLSKQTHTVPSGKPYLWVTLVLHPLKIVFVATYTCYWYSINPVTGLLQFFFNIFLLIIDICQVMVTCNQYRDKNIIFKKLTVELIALRKLIQFISYKIQRPTLERCPRCVFY